MATIDERRGTIFAGRYRLERKLGGGGMADVWLAEDQELGRKVAIKMLHDRYANDTQFVERFRREATHAAGLSHPNVVSIFDRGEAGGSYFIVMEYVEGRTLKELIVTRGPCPVPVAISYVRQVLAALRYAHRNGIVHRDIKPHNVLVDHEGRVKVADFGIARAGSSQMTEAGSIIGTAQYLSPEQARGAPVDESSDLYSTGILLFELLTGKVPFTGETPVEIAMKHLSQVPPAPSSIRSEIPHDLDLVVLRALAKEPADRYRSAKEMDRDLELVGRGDAVGPETEEAATMVLRGESTAADVRPAQTGRVRRRRALSRLRGPGQDRPGVVAVARRRGSRDRARDRRLAPVRQHPRPDRRERAGRGQYLHRHPRAEGRRADRRGRLRAQRAAAAERGRPARLRVPAGPGAGDEAAARVDRHDPRLQRQAEGDGAEPRGQVARRRGGGADPPAARAQRGAGELLAAGEPGHGPEPEAGCRRRRRLLGPDQRLVRPETGCGAERHRSELRLRRRTAPVRRLHRRPGGRRLRTSLPARSSTRARPATRPPRTARP